jgi:hypothetical protein
MSKGDTWQKTKKCSLCGKIKPTERISGSTVLSNFQGNVCNHCRSVHKRSQIDGRLKRYYEYFFQKAVMSGRVYSRGTAALHAALIFNVQLDHADRILTVVEAKLPHLVKHSLRERAQSARIDRIKMRPFSVVGEVCHD